MVLGSDVQGETCKAIVLHGSLMLGWPYLTFRWSSAVDTAIPEIVPYA